MTFLVATLLFMTAAAGSDVAFDPSNGLVEVEVTLDGRATGRFGSLY